MIHSGGIELDEALELTRTGDVWLFRGRSAPDRAIQMTTNSPVNHVGMSVVIEDLPPLMWHAELGRSLPDMWTGTHQRGVQLHDLRDAVVVWARRYGQRAWLRQLDAAVTREMEDALLRTIARLDGTPFPSTAGLAGRWLRGRLPLVHGRGRKADDREESGSRGDAASSGEVGNRRTAWHEWTARTARVARVARVVGNRGADGNAGQSGSAALETAYCAEVVAATYEAMGLLPGGRRLNWYDPGRFWSGDELVLSGGARLGGEIPVRIPPEARPSTR
ncbi:hypothetical protein Ssi03_19170 [Sphaerisporangium siamense]|uniref:Guanylate cyclase n=1 Tax=Sphaerisporangium siamense TaxID=795645 RepID=A0A7W7DEH3_9ACTN|nr:hypothetical protein [Sphaerisporangium siamense]MBB4705121.1 hypothetical protein [Sphaerisporangium siamense]GII83927.1 hypothetical protein Ssi03_19170 [Sphaerisporangium siamense]